MKIKLLISILLLAKFCTVFASDTTLYIAKYRYIFQKDSLNVNNKSDDVMFLTIQNKATTYFSYLKQFGDRNLDGDIANNVSLEDISNTNRGNYFVSKESEIIEINYRKKTTDISDKIVQISYCYRDTLIAPVWKLEKDLDSILKLPCQKATTIYKGRAYTAWFTKSIPLPYGPWFFNGLPGLILKISDTQNQFAFECIELNVDKKNMNVYKPYTDCISVAKKRLKDKKKFYLQNPLEYMVTQTGKTISGGNGLSLKRPNKPYNPIDLSENK